MQKGVHPQRVIALHLLFYITFRVAPMSIELRPELPEKQYNFNERTLFEQDVTRTTAFNGGNFHLFEETAGTRSDVVRRQHGNALRCLNTLEGLVNDETLWSLYINDISRKRNLLMLNKKLYKNPFTNGKNSMYNKINRGETAV